jgi:hypothetical protein
MTGMLYRGSTSDGGVMNFVYALQHCSLWAKMGGYCLICLKLDFRQ